MPKQMRYRCVTWLLVALLLLTGFVQPATTWAQPADEEPNSMVTSYAQANGISYAEAERRLQLQSEMDGLESKVRENEPSYAGSWTQHQPTFGLVVAFAAPNGEELIQKYLAGIAWADLVMVQEAPYTDEELYAIAAQVIAAARATGIPFASGPNYQRSKVTFWTAQPDELRTQLTANPAIVAYLDDIEYIYEAAPPVPAADEEQMQFKLYLPTFTFN